MRRLIDMNEDELRNLIRESIEGSFNTLNAPAPTEELPTALLTMDEVSQIFKVSRVTLHKWRRLKLLPPVLKKGGRVYFRKSQIMAMIEARGKYLE